MRDHLSYLLLGLLLLVFVPAVWLTQATNALEGQLRESEQELDRFRQTQRRTAEVEARLAEYFQEARKLEGRLLSADPFREIYQEVTAAAARTGVTVLPLQIGGAEQVEGLPELVRYPVQVRVTGEVSGFIQFIEQLEKHPLLIELPRLDLEPDAGGSLTDDLSIVFFGRAADAPLAEPHR